MNPRRGPVANMGTGPVWDNLEKWGNWGLGPALLQEKRSNHRTSHPDERSQERKDPGQNDDPCVR